MVLLKKDPPPPLLFSWILKYFANPLSLLQATLKLGTQECILNENDRKASKAIL